jgi:HEAT repeat protein
MRLAVVFLLSFSTVFAEARPEILDRIRDYDMRHSDLLVKIVKDPETLRYAKVRALEKMSVIYRQSKAEGETVASRYLDGISAGLAHKSPDVREAACTAAIVFKESGIAPALVGYLTRALKEENSAVVIYACAHTLASFKKHSEAIVPALLAKVEKYLADYYDSSEDEKALAEVCRALGVMKARKSFIPLLKVLQSRYDEDVKSVAQEAIHEIHIH